MRTSVLALLIACGGEREPFDASDCFVEVVDHTTAARECELCDGSVTADRCLDVHHVVTDCLRRSSCDCFVVCDPSDGPSCTCDERSH